MQVFTYSKARQEFSKVLDQADSTGKVLIRRKDGRTYALSPERMPSSPLDVPSIKANISTQEIVSVIREGREQDGIQRSS
ncbi:MAG: type II toxin-antitoxin system Phd/YefM family antitoxin [Candidatus Omnitrophota bacterium]